MREYALPFRASNCSWLNFFKSITTIGGMDTHLAHNYTQKFKSKADAIDGEVVTAVICFNSPLHNHPMTKLAFNIKIPKFPQVTRCVKRCYGVRFFHPWRVFSRSWSDTACHRNWETQQNKGVADSKFIQKVHGCLHWRACQQHGRKGCPSSWCHLQGTIFHWWRKISETSMHTKITQLFPNNASNNNTMTANEKHAWSMEEKKPQHAE